MQRIVDRLDADVAAERMDADAAAEQVSWGGCWKEERGLVCGRHDMIATS